MLVIPVLTDKIIRIGKATKSSTEVNFNSNKKSWFSSLHWETKIMSAHKNKNKKKMNVQNLAVLLSHLKVTKK